jgi:hypothetical protein
MTLCIGLCCCVYLTLSLALLILALRREQNVSRWRRDI